MEQKIIDSYRLAFEELSAKFLEMQSQIKEGATQDVSRFLNDNHFDKSQMAITYLKELLGNITFNIDYNDIENSITEYNRQMENLKKDLPTSQPSEVKDVVPVKEEDSSQVQMIKNEPTQIARQPIDFHKAVQEAFLTHHFSIVQQDKINLEIEKNKKHYHFTLVNSLLSKEAYEGILDRKIEKKNIGFICETEELMKQAKLYVDNWINKTPDYKKKFLCIHFTTIHRLTNSNEKEIFDTQMFD